MNANQPNAMKQTLLFVSAVLLVSPVGLQAGQLRIAPVFSNQMVLQREKPVPVRVWIEPDEAVSVAFAGHRNRTALRHRDHGPASLLRDDGQLCS